MSMDRVKFSEAAIDAAKRQQQENKEPGVNPKELQGIKKPPMHLIPPSALVHMSMALKDGAKKYGPFNWRDDPIRLTTYVGAIYRHLSAFQDHEDLARDSGRHHLAHIMACCAIALDSIDLGMVVDDRPKAGKSPDKIEEFTNEGDVVIEEDEWVYNPEEDEFEIERM